MNTLVKMALASTFIFSVSISQAATITCNGKSAEGKNITFKHRTRPDGSVKVSIIESENGKVQYKNSWIGDQSDRALKSDTLTLHDSSGNRGEYYSKLDLAGSDQQAKASLSYQENDSGWEYSVEVSQATCEIKN